MQTDPMQDWITIWRSEMAGMAQDRELREGVEQSMAAWQAVVQASRDALGGPGPDAAARATAADAASVARDGEIACLTARIDDLERRLAKLEPPHRPRVARRDRGIPEASLAADPPRPTVPVERG